MLGVRLISRSPSLRRASGACCVFGMVAVLAWLPLLSPAAAAEASSDHEALIASLEGLRKAVNEKVASDIDDVAWALWSVHEVEKARFLADLICAPLAVIQQAIATVAAIKSVQDVEAGLANAYSTPLGSRPTSWD
jgi:hypothetical protein